MMDHLKHMANVRPDGLDRSAAIWAMDEIARLRIEKEVLHGLLKDLVEASKDFLENCPEEIKVRPSTRKMMLRIAEEYGIS